MLIIQFLSIICVLYTPISGLIDKEEFALDALKAHNDYRKLHGVPLLKLNVDISKISQTFAEKIAEAQKLARSDNTYLGEILGENIAQAFGYTPYTGERVTKLWYNGQKNYNYSLPEYSSKTGGFTQVVWKSTTDVGFGIAQATDATLYVVANYYPPGNAHGEFEVNVLKPIAPNKTRTVPNENPHRVSHPKVPTTPTKITPKEQIVTPTNTTVNNTTSLTSSVIGFELFKLDENCNLIKFNVPLLQKAFQFSYCDQN